MKAIAARRVAVQHPVTETRLHVVDVWAGKEPGEWFGNVAGDRVRMRLATSATASIAARHALLARTNLDWSDTLPIAECVPCNPNFAGPIRRFVLEVQ